MADYTLDDAFANHILHPDTFKIPFNDEITAIKKGDWVKLCFIPISAMPERMWVRVTSIEGEQYTGTLDNDPAFIKAIKCGDTVLFYSKNIYDIMKRD